MDNEINDEITSALKKIKGGGTLATDSVTIGGKSYLLYMYSKGSISLFLKSSQLGKLVHVTNAEVEDVIKVMKQCNDRFKSSLTALAVDNGAQNVMAKAVEQYAQQHPTLPPLLMNRDCAHCIDLLAKDSSSIPCFALLLTDAYLLINLLLTVWTESVTVWLKWEL